MWGDFTFDLSPNLSLAGQRLSQIPVFEFADHTRRASKDLGMEIACQFAAK